MTGFSDAVVQVWPAQLAAVPRDPLHLKPAVADSELRAMSPRALVFQPVLVEVLVEFALPHVEQRFEPRDVLSLKRRLPNLFGITRYVASAALYVSRAARPRSSGSACAVATSASAVARVRLSTSFGSLTVSARNKRSAACRSPRAMASRAATTMVPAT
jgi:hypothetical protein